MSNPANLLLSCASLLRLTSILIALLLAPRFEPRAAALLQGKGASPPGAVLRTLFWLGLGAIFAVPLFDLVARVDREDWFGRRHGRRPPLAL